MRIKSVLNAPWYAGYDARSKCYKSLYELDASGITHTFKWKVKQDKFVSDDWTSQVTRVLTLLDIPFTVGNDAPKGGKEGTYVKLIK